MKKDELSLLLYLETQAVDHAGAVRGASMNQDDFALAKAWNESGFIRFGRICAADCKDGQRSHWVKLSDRAWELAHEERKAGAERMWAKKRYETTAEKRGVQ